MEVPGDTELQMAVVGVGSAGFVAQTETATFLRKLESSGVNRSADRKRLHHTTRREPRGPVQMGTRFIVTPAGGLKDTVEACEETQG